MISHYFLKIKNKNIQLMFKNAQLIMSFMMIKVKYKGMFHRNVSSFILNFFRVNLFDCQVCSWKVCYSTCRQQPEVTTLSCPINSKSAGETELPLHPFLWTPSDFSTILNKWCNGVFSTFPTTTLPSPYRLNWNWYHLSFLHFVDVLDEQWWRSWGPSWKIQNTFPLVNSVTHQLWQSWTIHLQPLNLQRHFLFLWT